MRRCDREGLCVIEDFSACRDDLYLGVHDPSLPGTVGSVQETQQVGQWWFFLDP